MTPQKLAKSSLLRILLPLGLVLGAVFLTVRQANVLLHKALQASFAGHASDFESVWFDWNGNVTAKQVMLRPREAAAGAGEVRFERVWMETGGWGFFLRHAFDRDLQSAALPRLHLVFGDARVLDGLATLVPELGPVGPASGAMFEADGCGRSEAFTREALSSMGLSPGGTSLEVDRSVDGDAMSMLVALATPGSSRTQLERRGRLEAPRASLLGEPAEPRIESERWSVRDQGFVAARNRLCATQDGITPRETLERHIAAIDRRAQRAGLAVDDNAKAFYRRFARSGGEMSFGGAYQPPLSVAEARAQRDDGRALARMNATLERDTRAVPIVWRVTPATATPGEEAVAEVSTPADAGTPPAGPEPGTPGIAPVAEAPVAATPSTEPASPLVTPPAPPATPVAEPQAPAAETPTPAPASETPAQETAASTPEPAVTEPPVATPPVASPARPGAPRIERAPPATRRESLAFEDLARHAGRQVRIWTMHNPPRTVHILGGDGNEVRVRAKLGGGQAEYTVKREGFLRASLVR